MESKAILKTKQGEKEPVSNTNMNWILFHLPPPHFNLLDLGKVLTLKNTIQQIQYSTTNN